MSIVGPSLKGNSMNVLHVARRRQRGMSFFGLIFTAIIVAFAGLLAIQVLPTVNEYLTVQRTIKKVLDDNPGSIPAIRTAFDRQKTIEYAINTISGSDLEISQQGDKTTVSFAYDKQVPIMDPVYLLIKYKGSQTR
jgi:hypothetical protein